MSFDTPTDPDEELPDWLKDLQGGSDSQAGADDPDAFSSSDEQEAEAWLSSFTSDPDDAPQDQLEDTPDWLKTIREAEGGAEGDSFELTSSETEDDDTADWLQSIQKEERAAAGDEAPDMASSEDEESTDWLESIRQQHARDTGSLEGLSEEPEADDFLDRLQDMQAGEGAAEDQQGADWLSGLAEDQESQPEDAGGIDWLSGIGENANDSTGQDEEADWLNALESEEGAEPSGAADGWLRGIAGDDPVIPEGDRPDWLADTTDEEDAQPQPAFDLDSWAEDQDAAAAGVQEEFPGLAGGEAETSVPSWLEGLEAKAPEATDTGSLIESPGSAAFIADFEDEDIDFKDPDLPDWLSESSPTASEGGVEPGPAAKEDSLDITPGELPSWLQAMRPEEVVTPAGIPEPTGLGGEEKVGPLAGLRDVLPAEADIVHFGGKPPEQINNVQVSDAQYSYINILNEILLDEEEAAPPTRRAVAIPQQVMRWVIAGLLYLFVLIPIFTLSSSIPLLVAAPPEIQSVRDLVNAIPSGAPVLVAVDYQPGLSGEMSAASSSLLDHLLIGGAHLAFISTNPSGPALTEYLVQTNLSDHSYILDYKYPNLGFVSGGTAALFNFATDPRGTTPVLDENGVNLWDQPPLNGIQQIGDFTLVVVISDDPDNARGWIEQVQPALVDPVNPNNSTPLVMVVSAQAEPLVYPYYDNSPRQVTGIIAGVAGGATYESGVRPKIAHQYWHAFSWGTSLTAIILVVVGLVSLGRGWLNQRKRKG